MLSMPGAGSHDLNGSLPQQQQRQHAPVAAFLFATSFLVSAPLAARSRGALAQWAGLPIAQYGCRA
jgi:hypothetical protein